MTKTISYFLFYGLFCFFCFAGCKDQLPSPPTESELVAAVMAGQAALADSLLQAGVSPNSRDEEGNPVLILAINAGQSDLVKKLVTAGAAINARREAYFKSTALMELGVRNDSGLAAWLLDHGADLTLRDTLGDTPLNWASFYGHQDLVALYLDRGADWSVAGRQGTALDIALHRGHRELVRFFIARGAGKKLTAPEQILFTSIRNNDLEGVIRAIEKEDADPDATDELGTPALIQTADLGEEEILIYLLRRGANKNAMNRVGETAMARAARFGHRAIVNRLLSLKADPDIAGDAYMLTPLIAAAQAGEAGIIQELIASGANPNTPERINGFTPLMLATAGGHVEAVKALLAGGASVYIKSNEGAGLYDMLRYSNNAEIGEIIRERLLQEE